MFTYQGGVLAVCKYRRVLRLHEEEVAIEFKNYILSVRGRDLHLIYFENVELRIAGVIDIVEIKHA